MPVYGSYGAPEVNNPSTYSTVSLNNDWSSQGRFLILVLLVTGGTLINTCFIASFFVDKKLKKRGNVYLASTAIADMIITSIVMPITIMVQVLEQYDSIPVCWVTQFLTEASAYCYNMCFMMVALDSYKRYCRSAEEYQRFLYRGVGIITGLIFVCGFGLAGVGVYFGWDYDYCKRVHLGNFYYRMATSVIFYIIPFTVTIVGLLHSRASIFHRVRTDVNYRGSDQYYFDNNMNILNFATYFLFVAFWIPYSVIVTVFPYTHDYNFYNSVWFGTVRSCFICFLYILFNLNFRYSFSNLFNYSFWKFQLNNHNESNHRNTDRNEGEEIEMMNVCDRERVHVMQPMFDRHSPQTLVLSYENENPISFLEISDEVD